MGSKAELAKRELSNYMDVILRHAHLRDLESVVIVVNCASGCGS